jgi:hypothetical protein
MCGSGRNIDIGHINGHEEDDAPRNKIWQCRSCNVRCANALRAAGLGRLTRQFNPSDAPEPDDWLIARARATAGGGRTHSVEQLIGAYRMYGAVLQRTPADRESRRKFYAIEDKLRAGLGAPARQFNPAEGAQSLGQWLTAVMSMKGESTEMPVNAAVALIRATPPARRSQFAQEIWDKRREHHGPTGRSDSVPF